MTLNKTRSLSIVVLVSLSLLASCSSSNSSEAIATTASPETSTSSTSTTELATTTTSTTIAVPVSNCAGTEESLAEFVGEPLGFFVCDTEWASFMTKEYAQTCENCESITIARWVNGTWKEIGNFNQYSSLSPGEVSSKISKESLCAIWSTNRSSEFAAKTGCTPDI
ncbi:hypothetical protein HQ459_05270 [bacterium]|nr:hypothetical protein [bacterium]